jgi:hypothetical protein
MRRYNGSMKLRIAALVAVAPLLLLAHEPAGKPITLTAKVVDTGCFFGHETPGDHTACATACAKNGVPLALLDGSGKLFFVIAADHKNPNTKLLPFVEKKVKVTGTEIEKGGLHGVLIKTVEAAE